MKSKGMDFFQKQMGFNPRTKNAKAPETLDTNGNVKTTPNLYLQPLDTMEDTNIDTTNLDFSSSNFSKNDLEKQNKDIVDNATEFLVTNDNGT
ncbi:hypothetical protein QMA64_10180 [Leuconostoc suionicum]|uniref:hypothetical protein n=1 Tax=Leuconostoc suionicum TaxID=1511761 RepID=UPI0024ADE40A|nr:hypothetical protein [Leuconostoc suionicum]MDI6614949.1 hypothetical protein [Leuconostoc suionicum]